MTVDNSPGPRDASEIGSSAAKAAWAEAARPVLVVAAGRYRALVTYKQLADAVQESSGVTTSAPMAQWLAGVLGSVTADCHSRGEPLLSSICVSFQGSVGEQYAEAVEDARGVRPNDPDEHAATERLNCYRHWEAKGLPSDGGSPLRTAHFKPARKAAATKPATPRKTAPRKVAARPPTSAAAAVAAPTEKPIPLCPTCYTQVPPSGVCYYCED